MNSVAVPARFYSLDVLRGIAALSVVVFHWRHFFYDGAEPGSDAPPEQPLLAALFVPYRAGWLAVDLFFALSGFIFFWMYARPIGDRTVSAREFFVLRMSRLYPLHFATLIAVIIFQALYQLATGGYFVYASNDAYHLVLNLLFLSSWGFEGGYSYNAPVWSVSVEMFLYAVFFLQCRVMKPRMWVLLGIALASYAIFRLTQSQLARGAASFHMGGLAYLVYLRVVHSSAFEKRRTARGGPRGGWAVTAFIGLTLALWLVTVLNIAGPAESLGWTGWPDLSGWTMAFPVFILFPWTILVLAVLEAVRGSLGRRLAFIGDLSYSSYLVHFPVQIALALVVVLLGFDRSVFTSPWLLGAFVMGVVALALASHRLLEVPMQRYLRRRWLRRAGA